MDILWLILSIPALLISLFAQFWLKNTYSKYSTIPTKFGINGLEAGNIIIHGENLMITTEPIQGELTDHYDSQNNIMRISTSNTKNSLASVAVVAHELGHACQDRDNYYFLKLRNRIVPLVNIGSNLGYILIIAGFILSMTGLTYIGLALFSLSFIFTVVTLPVEIDASNRAIMLLEKHNVLSGEELGGARKVLNAAASTYVAAVASSFMQVLYFFLQTTRRGD